MNSLQLSSELRKVQHQNKEQDIFLNDYLQIIHLVKNSMEIKKYRSLHLQVDKFYKRPLSIQALEKIVMHAERIQNQPEVARQRSSLDSQVLIADDDTFVSFVLDNIL